MREFSVPASVRVDDCDTLSDTVFALAEEHPGAVALRRRHAVAEALRWELKR